MSLATVYTRATQGIEAPLVRVETHLSNGLPAFSMVGLAETAVRESRDRVRAAMMSAEFEFPASRITVNLAPADLPKAGGYYDLPVAVGILAASGQLPAETLADYELVGELALNGELRGERGVLPIAIAARRAGRALVVPQSAVAEACLVKGLTVYGAAHLTEVCAHLAGLSPLEPAQHQPARIERGGPDLADVRGQEQAKRALEVAAAGGHHLLMVGPPGTGKTMLASRLPGLLPPMSESEAMGAAAVQSISQSGFQVERWGRRPFRAPHHTVSGVALVGGGTNPRPGEISLAHGGVLFLDELTEFARSSLEVLREPIESGVVTISRAARQAQFPARFQLVAAMNPCPCGYRGDPQRACRCTPDQVERYRSKVSGPLLDRIDMHIEVPRLSESELLGRAPAGEGSHRVAERVARARAMQRRRQRCSNAHLCGHQVEAFCALDAEGEALIEQAMRRLSLSVRAYHRVLKVARTLADLGGRDAIEQNDLAEALGFRQPG
ncbi:MAG: YifB family Mg chelatase-like AAA ATPase [Pseudomonadota bacterium]